MADRPMKKTGARLRLAPQADLDVFYAADAARYAVSDRAELDVVTREVFIEFYRNCPSIGFEADGRPIGGIIFDGEEAHIAVLPQYHGRWAALLKPALEWLFSLRDEIVVEIERDNTVCMDFMKRNRWQCLDADDETARFRMTAQGGQRKTPYPFSRGDISTSHNAT
jgi:GNAT superfamily N-acetyltransferase